MQPQAMQASVATNSRQLPEPDLRGLVGRIVVGSRPCLVQQVDVGADPGPASGPREAILEENDAGARSQRRLGAGPVAVDPRAPEMMSPKPARQRLRTTCMAVRALGL